MHMLKNTILNSLTAKEKSGYLKNATVNISIRLGEGGGWGGGGEGEGNRPGWTFAVDSALTNNYLSTGRRETGSCTTLNFNKLSTRS